jgi:hypothetical protein
MTVLGIIHRSIVVLGTLPLALMGAAVSSYAAVPSSELKGAENCAETEAAQLHAKLDATKLDDTYTEATEAELMVSGGETEQIIVTARDLRGRVLAEMVCTYDKRGEVLDMRKATAYDEQNMQRYWLGDVAAAR